MQEFAPLPDEITLRLGDVKAQLSPWGASLTQLEVAGRTVIEHVSAHAAHNAFAGVTLAPWPNRLRDGKWQFQGQRFRFERLDAKKNANHGLVFDRKFDITKQTDDLVTFQIELGADVAYPFNIQLDVVYHLTANGIESAITARNLGSVVAPIAFGAHPYIIADAESVIKIEAAVQFVNDSQQIPVDSEPATKSKSADGSPLKFETLELDDCFAELVRDSGSNANTKVIWGDGSEITVWQDASFKYLMVFAHHAMGSHGMSGEAIAIEPQTAPANALGSATDLFMLESHQEKTARWGIIFQERLQESR